MTKVSAEIGSVTTSTNSAMPGSSPVAELRRVGGDGHYHDVRLNTVRNHVQNVLVKLDAHSKLAAVAIASRHGLLPPEGDDDRRPAHLVS